MLNAAWGETIQANPMIPAAIMAKATGMLVRSRTKRMRHPRMPMYTGLIMV